MDQLDILKEKWNQQDNDYPKVDANSIKNMLAQKSTSIVKWLLIIAVIEFVVMAGFNLLLPLIYKPNETTRMLMEKLSHSTVYTVIWVIHLIVIFYFIYLFYKNYKNISATQPTSSLMKNIIKTRRTMKQYIWYNIIGGFISGLIGAVFALNNDPKFNELLMSDKINGHETAIYLTVLFVTALMIAALMGILYLIYMLIYGILLKRLKSNYEELKRIEV